MTEKMRLIIIEFTAFSSKGERLFLTDITDKDSADKITVKDKTLEYAKAELEEMCHSVVYHRTVEYELSVDSKLETVLDTPFEIKPKHERNNPKK
jgi:hypothetical protein